jgi:TorA maturation chaperone TorD
MTADCETAADPVDVARECLYRFLAVALTDPRGPRGRLLADAASRRLAADAADLLAAEARAAPVPLGLGELPPDRLDLGPAVDTLERAGADPAAEYDRVFGLVSARECPPYETEYHSSGDPFFRAQQMADVAGFYRAFGLETSRRAPDRPDHLALELEFLAYLLLKKRLALGAWATGGQERAAVCDAAVRDFFRDHVAWWVPAFAAGLRHRAGGGFYATLADVLAALVPAERARLGLPAPRLPLRTAGAEQPDEEAAGCGGCAAAV